MRTGFFGKVPVAGDFVTRALPSGARRALDHWLTGAIAPLAREAKGWPEGGVRVAVMLNDMPWLLVVEPSADSVGRRYPLVACCPQGGADRKGADVWADAAWAALLAATESNASPDVLRDLLAQIPPPGAGPAPLVPPALWWDGTEPGGIAPQLAHLARLSSG